MSGSLIGGVIGGVIGFFVGGPTGAMYGFEIGAAAGGMLFPGKLPDQFGPRLNDLKVQISTYGTSIPIVYGRARLAGNVIWCTDLVEHSNTQDVGGKGGPSQSVTTYSYTISAAISICEGPIIGVRRIWADSTLIYDVSTSNTGSTSPNWIAAIFTNVFSSLGGGSGSSQQNGNGFIVYLGDENQLPDPTIEAHLGVGNVPAYRGQAYVVFTDFPLDKFGNRLPTFSFEVLTSGSPANTFIYYDQPNTIDSDWIYNPVVNEIWALSDIYGNPSQIVRIDPITKAVLGYIALGSQFPLANYFDDICYNAYDKTVWVNSDSNTHSYTARLDAGTGAVLNSVDSLGSRYVCNINPYTGDVYYSDQNSFAGWYRTKSDTTTANHYTNLPFYMGPVCFAPDGYAYICDYNYLSIYQLDPSTGSTKSIVAGRSTVNFDANNWKYLGNYWFPQDMAYDPGRDVLWVLAQQHSVTSSTVQYIFKFNRYDGTLLDAHQVASGSFSSLYNFGVPGSQPHEKFYDPQSDAFWLTRINNPIGTANGNITGLRAADYSVIVNTTANVAFTYYNPPLDTTILGSVFFGWRDVSASDTQPARLIYNRLATSTTYLSDILTDISVRSGQLTSGDIDVTGQTSTVVDGYVISRQSSGRSVIEQLQQAYFFDMVESDDKVKFVNRTGVSVATIPDDDLAAFEAAQKPPDDLAITREMESTLPQALNINYMSENADYQTGTQQSRRLVGATGDLQTFDLPIVLSDDKAKQIVESAMYAMWTARTTYKFTTGMKYAKYEPTDVVTVKGHNIRLTKRTDNNGVILWEGAQEEGQTYTQTATGTVTAFTPQTIANAVFTDLELMDINLLRDADDGAGFYYAADGYTTGWPGMALFKSSDGGSSYANIGSLTTGAAIGRTNGTLGNFTGGNIFDYINTITVSLIGGGTLSSTTELAVLNGANAALIGSEIIQYKTATLNADGTYTLSGLLRGRRGTDFAIANHTQGERFIGLSLSTVGRASMTTAEIGLARLYKGVTFGDSLANTSALTFTDTAAGLKPYSPCQLTATRDMSGNITANWIRRTRIGGEWRDFVEVPLSETSEQYDLEIWDSGYTSLKRSFLGLTSPTVVYGASSQIADWGSTQSVIYVKIYQIGAVGRGYAYIGSA